MNNANARERLQILLDSISEHDVVKRESFELFRNIKKPETFREVVKVVDTAEIDRLKLELETEKNRYRSLLGRASAAEEAIRQQQQPYHPDWSHLNINLIESVLAVDPDRDAAMFKDIVETAKLLLPPEWGDRLTLEHVPALLNLGFSEKALCESLTMTHEESVKALKKMKPIKCAGVDERPSWWLAINGASVAMSHLPLVHPDCSPRPQQLLGYRTCEEARYARDVMLHRSVDEMRRYCGSIRPMIASGKIRLIEFKMAEPPTHGPTVWCEGGENV